MEKIAARHKIVTLRQLIFALSAMMCFSIATVLATGISFYSREAVVAHTKRLFEAERNLFIDHISQDILTGMYSEVHRKCDLFLHESGVASVKVVTSAGETLCDSHAPKRERLANELSGKIFFDESGTKPAATVTIVPHDVSIAEFFPSALSWSLSLAGCAAVLLSVINFFALSMTFKSWITSLRKLASASDVTPELIESMENKRGWLQIHESVVVIQQFKRLAGTIINQQHRISEIKERNARADLAAQVAHDIRSPLSALNLVVRSLGGLPEEKRLIVSQVAQRINDIANGLLDSSKRHSGKNGETIARNDSGEPSLLVTILDSIASEKRIQFRERMEIKIISDLSEGYGLFAFIEPAAFARVISNLMNNSVESIVGPGEVSLKVRSEKNWIVIELSDTGKGIPADVLPKLGLQGFSYEKSVPSAGSGLGLFHARDVVDKAGGKMQIESQVGSGTKVSIFLKRAEAPAWFIDELSISAGTTVVTVDDDSTIHQIWAERLKRHFGDLLGHVSFSSLEAFQKWAVTNRTENHLYLVDFEFLGQAGNGLQAIKSAGIAERSILVTSRFEENSVRSLAKLLGVKMIPKPQAPLVPLKIRNERRRYDAVLIDNDDLVHEAWKMAAFAKNKTLSSFHDPRDFFRFADRVDFETDIYVDIDLGDGVRGEDIASRIASLGFTRIYLSTGFAQENILVPNGVSGVFGKEPVF